MAPDPIVSRLRLVPVGGDDSMRRYRLARMDDVALASPPYELPENSRARRNGGDPGGSRERRTEDAKRQ